MLRTVDLSKSYRPGTWALRDVSLCAPGGALTMLLGANGAGKTTLINCLLDFIRPSAGRAFIDDIDVAIEPLPAKRRLAYLAETLSVYPALTGLENLRFFSGLGSRTRLSRRDAAELLDAMRLPATAHRRPVRDYSKGMRQKLGLAIALARGATNVVLDEPTTGLDPSAVRELFQVLRELRGQGQAILMTTHDVHRAALEADSACVMKEGRVVAQYAGDVLRGLDVEGEYLRIMVQA